MKLERGTRKDVGLKIVELGMAKKQKKQRMHPQQKQASDTRGFAVVQTSGTEPASDEVVDLARDASHRGFAVVHKSRTAWNVFRTQQLALLKGKGLSFKRREEMVRGVFIVRLSWVDTHCVSLQNSLHISVII